MAQLRRRLTEAAAKADGAVLVVADEAQVQHQDPVRATIVNRKFRTTAATVAATLLVAAATLPRSGASERKYPDNDELFIDPETGVPKLKPLGSGYIPRQPMLSAARSTRSGVIATAQPVGTEMPIVVTARLPSVLDRPAAGRQQQVVAARAQGA
ncbi:hypothetical protein [Streptomyces anandii]|uniref:hypothetical protein n=1 Tax=Streptomyces anandii TaxID=285454 RepID=UPI001674A472|nr:hypothetical protein [Streptomyces anandii]GGY13630.1 hypothetical protein GCM10010510_69590 [Streptomyces anandii JCM 4720]